MTANYLAQCHKNWPIEQRLVHYSKRDPFSGCLVWHGSVNEWGYGRISVKGRKHLAHRLAWTIEHGSIPVGLHVCHRCDERRCINTDHLFLGSHAANMTDLRKKKQAWYGHSGRTAPADVSLRTSADEAPIRVLYRGIEFIGKAIARPIDPAMPFPTPSPAPPAGRAPGARSRRCAARRGRPRRTASPVRRGR